MGCFRMIWDCFIAKNAVFAVKQLKIMLKKTSEKRCLESCEHLFALFFEWFLPCFCVGFTCGGASNQCLLGVELLSFVIACIANLLISNSIAY